MKSESRIDRILASQKQRRFHDIVVGVLLATGLTVSLLGLL